MRIDGPWQQVDDGNHVDFGIDALSSRGGRFCRRFGRKWMGWWVLSSYGGGASIIVIRICLEISRSKFYFSCQSSYRPIAKDHHHVTVGGILSMTKTVPLPRRRSVAIATAPTTIPQTSSAYVHLIPLPKAPSLSINSIEGRCCQQLALSGRTICF